MLKHTPRFTGRQPAGLLEALLVALGYYLSGRLGLLLAIPPGYATAVWPASGIALASVILFGNRVAVGVFAGSFAINILTGLDTSSATALLHSLPLPVAIGLGAALQAVVGAALIHRMVGYHNLLVQELEVVWMLALGGPVACTINASIGVGSLYLKGLIPADNLLINWWTWWVGDSIGVLVFAPLVLIWSLKPGQPWRRQQLLSTLPLMAMFALVVWLFMFVSAGEQNRLRARFDDSCQDYLTRFQRDLGNDFQALHALTAFVRENSDPRRAPFERFAGSQLDLLAGVRSLSWVPLVPDAGRQAFEQSMRAQGMPDFAIREFDDQGGLKAAARRPQYAPVAYIVPDAGYERVRGFDDASEALRAATLLRARQSGQPTASPPITLVQDSVTRHGMLIALALNDTGGSTIGYAIAVVRTDAMIEAPLGGLARQGVRLGIYERAADGSESLLYGEKDAAAKGSLRTVLPLNVAGRIWQLHFWQPAEYLLAHRSWAVWTLLAGGMLFTGILGMFLLVVIGRSARVEMLVEERTAALAKAYSLLEQEAERSRQLELEARHHSGELTASNLELEQFAYVASHDLQAPLRNIGSFASLLDRRYRDQLSEEANEFLRFIRDSVAELQGLIDDLLQLSRVSPQNRQLAPVPLADAVHRACEHLKQTLEESNTELTVAPLPEVLGDVRLLTQLFQNLIGNAVKFQAPGQRPQVKISAERQDNGDWRCEVADNGIGIAAKQLEKVFQIFKRLHTSDKYPGTGIGLALCRKIVNLHGGRIWVESTPGVGSRFIFTLPAA